MAKIKKEYYQKPSFIDYHELFGEEYGKEHNEEYEY